MGGPLPEHERLLARVRVVASVVVLGLLAYAVIVERDISVLGMLFGALAVLLGLASLERVIK